MKPLKLSIKEIHLLFICSIVVSIFFIYHFAFNPAVKKWSALKKEISREEIALKRNLRTIAESGTANLEYKKYAGYAKLNGSDEEEKALMMRQIEKLASDAGVYIKQMSPYLQKEKPRLYKKYSVELECETALQKLTKFIYLLRTSERPLKVEKLHLSSAKSSSGGQGVSLIKGGILITRVLLLPQSIPSSPVIARSEATKQSQDGLVKALRPDEYFAGDIKNRDLFKALLFKAKKPRVKPKPAAKKPPVDLKLVGIVETGKNLRAVIEDKQAGQAYLLCKGETKGKIKVKDISGEEVTIEYKGKISKLTLKSKKYLWQD